MPEILKLTKHRGVAGQVAYGATVQYPGEEPAIVTFVGNVYGGPVVMRTDSAEVFVSEPGRFGKFSIGWVRRFFEMGE